MADRIKLQILEVKEIEKIGEKQFPKLSFKAQANGVEQWYAAFKQDFFSVIQAKGVIDCEVETTETGQYTNRKITQIYKDGQPVGQKKGYAGKSAETVQIETAARAKNTALMQAVELAKVERIGLSDITRYANDFFTWLMKESVPQPLQSTQKPPEKPASITTQKAGDSKQAVKGDDYLAWLKGGISAAGTTNTEVMAWIKENFKIDKPTITDAVLKMTPAQKQELTKYINDMVDKVDKVF